ncbi:hypothetical protein Rwratislav_37982 [Rhodococcus wratislaviensis IFP 2016]|uniref:Uncharacterized protein n=1 Tax=Rhodococcus opacus M213 TaxID=1129896 RepID=K8Y3S0_RHOOP|nr:hypothetical protein WSS_A02280 [Rhodococcus opacus M213]ELB87787.1 hypothetical protein Rwratislav_37982 [Rhodococcus wratislaviensis IFP 2016]
MYLLVDPDEIGIKHAEDSPGLHVGLGSSYGNGELDALLQRTGFGRVREATRSSSLTDCAPGHRTRKDSKR